MKSWRENFAFLPSLCVRCCLPLGMEGGSSCELEISPLRFTVHPNTAPVRTCNAPVMIPHLQVGGAHSTQQQQTDRKDLLFLVEAAELFPSLMLPLYNNTMWPPFLPQPHATTGSRGQTSAHIPSACCCLLPFPLLILEPLSVWSL